jgi:plasmid stabilization system protein ParE
MEPVIEFDDAARVEFDEAFDWYAKRSHGAAIGFAGAIDAALDSIVRDAARFPAVYAGCQYARIRRYPYSLIFRRSARGIMVVAVAHAKRKPGYWRRRLASE